MNFSEIVTGMWDKLEGEEVDSNLQRLPGAARLPYEKRFLKDSSIWHTKYRRVLVQESPDTSLRQQQRNIERIEQNIWRYPRKRWRYRRKHSLYNSKFTNILRYTETIKSIYWDYKIYKILYFIPLTKE